MNPLLRSPSPLKLNWMTCPKNDSKNSFMKKFMQSIKFSTISLNVVMERLSLDCILRLCTIVCHTCLHKK
eukprot:m.171297 g.171297  ORF g.171297 m.171297 type:complete len:70 (+) comp39053_c1_seq8:3714-3923(+)